MLTSLPGFEGIVLVTPSGVEDSVLAPLPGLGSIMLTSHPSLNNVLHGPHPTFGQGQTTTMHCITDSVSEELTRDGGVVALL